MLDTNNMMNHRDDIWRLTNIEGATKFYQDCITKTNALLKQAALVSPSSRSTDLPHIYAYPYFDIVGSLLDQVRSQYMLHFV